MENGVEEEGEDDQSEDATADLEPAWVFDAVAVLEFSHVAVPDTRQFVAEQPADHHQPRNDAHQDGRTHFDDEVVEGHATVGQSGERWIRVLEIASGKALIRS